MTSSFSPATPLQPRKRAMIVGACGGLGTALTRKLAREGWTLALLSRREDCPENLAAELNADGVTRALSYIHDVTDYAEVPSLLKKIVADLGGVDLLIYQRGHQPASRPRKNERRKRHQNGRGESAGRDCLAGSRR